MCGRSAIVVHSNTLMGNAFDEYRVLLGKKLKREQNQADRDFSGGGFYHEETTTIWLYADDTFEYEESTFSSVSSGGLSLPRETKKTASGTWTVRTISGAPHLVLSVDGEVFASWRTSNGGTGVQFLDGERWSRYRIG